MKPGGGKGKGSAFERDVCKGLSLWLTRNEDADILWRSAISGGRATVAAKKGKFLGHVSGDVCAVHELGYPFVKQFYVECKFLKNLHLTRLVIDNEGPLLDIWKTTVDWADTYDKLPVLVAKQNQHEPIVVLNQKAAECLRLDRLDEYASFPQLGMYVYPFTYMLDAQLPWRTLF